MNIDFKRLLLVFIVSTITCSCSFGQSCIQNLKKAQNSYDEGKISEVPSILKSCIESGFNKEELIASYRLLTLTYIYLDEPVKADEFLLKLLKIKPEYKINRAIDPAEFINLFNKYRTEPILKVGAKAGINWLSFNVIQQNNTNGNSRDNIKMKSKAGFQIGFTSEININKKLEFAPELLYSVKEFNFEYKVEESISHYNEKFNTLSLPLLFRYSFFSKKNIVPYLIGGCEGSFLLIASSNTSGTLVSTNTNVTSERQSLSYSLVAGGGLKSKMGPGLISLGLRYVYGLNDQIREVYPNNGAHTLSFGSVISRYRLNSLNLNVGYALPVYKPKKIK